MSKEKDANFYTGKGYLKVGKDAYRPLYQEVVNLLPEGQARIIDLGCGVGYFARFLLEKGYKYYVGIDFSEHMIELAKKQAPDFEYMLLDLYDSRLKRLIAKHRIFTILETLEHISNDLKVLKNLPSGATIIGSVPSSKAEGHVRIFKGPWDVSRRYSSMIKFDFFKPLIINKRKPKNIITVFRGTII